MRFSFDFCNLVVGDFAVAGLWVVRTSKSDMFTSAFHFVKGKSACRKNVEVGSLRAVTLAEHT